MIKLKNYWVLIIFFPVFMAKGQMKSDPNLMLFNTVVTYEYSYQSDSTNDSKIDILTELHINDAFAVFQTQRKRQSDSIIYSEKGFSDLIAVYGGPISPVSFRIIQAKDTIQTLEPLNGLSLSINNELYSYKEKTDLLEWEIQEDISTINDIPVQKATLQWEGRKWMVWFATDIPISHGPYKFCGLPGLIIQVTDQQNMFSFNLISIENKRSQLPKEPRSDIQYVNTIKEEFYKERKYLKENMYEILLAKGNSPNEKTKDAMQEVGRKDNNHIEKY